MSPEMLTPMPSVVDQAAIVVGWLDRAGVLYATPQAALSSITRLANSREGVERRYVSGVEAIDYTESARTISKLLTDAYNRMIGIATLGSDGTEKTQAVPLNGS